MFRSSCRFRLSMVILYFFLGKGKVNGVIKPHLAAKYYGFSYKECPQGTSGFGLINGKWQNMKLWSEMKAACPTPLFKKEHWPAFQNATGQGFPFFLGAWWVKSCLFCHRGSPQLPGYGLDTGQVKCTVTRGTVIQLSPQRVAYTQNYISMQKWRNHGLMAQEQATNSATRDYKGVDRPCAAELSVSWTHEILHLTSPRAQPQWQLSVQFLQTPSTGQPEHTACSEHPVLLFRRETQASISPQEEAWEWGTDFPFAQIPSPLTHSVGGRNLGESICDQRVAATLWPTGDAIATLPTLS